MLRLTAGTRTREAGLTLVETIVGLVIIGIVAAIVTTWLSDAVTGTERATGRADASVAVDHALDRLRQDLSAARARDRASDAVYDPLDFAASIRTGSGLRGYDADGVTVRNLDVQDVVRATPNDVVFSSSGPTGTRCVRWRAARGELVRQELGSVNAGCSPSMPVASARTLVRRTADARSTLASPFTYTVVATAPTGCTSSITATVPVGRLGTVVAVNVDVQALAGHEGADGRSGRQVRIDLRSRLAEEYQRALGCAR